MKQAERNHIALTNKTLSKEIWKKLDSETNVWKDKTDYNIKEYAKQG